MTSHPIYILVILLLIEGFILTLDNRPVGKKLFKFLPSMFWIYFLPMLANTAGLVPSESPFYGTITRWVLPAALILLLLSADIRGIIHLGPIALSMMAASVFGVMAGAVTVTALFRHSLPPDAWMGIGALSASWIGGSANMIAVKEATGTPDRVFLPMVIVDTIIPYFWMGLLIAMSACQKSFDRWNHSDTRLLNELTARTAKNKSMMQNKRTLAGVVFIIALAIGGSYASVCISQYLPEVKNIFSSTAWAIIISTILGIALSFTPVRKLESSGSNTAGFALLYFVLASIGAKTSLRHLDAVPVLLAAGATWIAIHGFILVLAAHLLKAPMALAAAASQASIGGPASAPVVAGGYLPQLAPVGLLLAVLGNILGTFLGLITSRLCQMVW